MWMLDSNDHHTKDLKMPTDPVYGRKLRPLMPRPISSCTAKNSPYSTPSCCGIQNPNILQWNHPICGLSDYGVKREIQTVPLVSTRWNPTPEQLQTLEEMYRRGIRTPSAEQIQQIAAKLRRFGKIEGKNVFYWFQNHKARERQKKRRQLELLAGKKMHHAHTLQTNETGLSRRSCIEIEHQKLANSSTPPEDSASMQAAVAAPAVEWPQLHRKELHHTILTAKNETCCWQLDLSSSLSPSNAVTAQKATAPKNEMIMKENQTLELFPIGFTSLNNAARDQEAHDASIIETKFRPIQFIEFLPTKKMKGLDGVGTS